MIHHSEKYLIAAGVHLGNRTDLNNDIRPSGVAGRRQGHIIYNLNHIKITFRRAQNFLQRGGAQVRTPLIGCKAGFATNQRRADLRASALQERTILAELVRSVFVHKHRSDKLSQYCSIVLKVLIRRQRRKRIFKNKIYLISESLKKNSSSEIQKKRLACIFLAQYKTSFGLLSYLSYCNTSLNYKQIGIF